MPIRDPVSEYKTRLNVEKEKKQSSFYTYPTLLTVVHGSTAATPVSVKKKLKTS